MAPSAAICCSAAHRHPRRAPRSVRVAERRAGRSRRAGRPAVSGTRVGAVDHDRDRGRPRATPAPGRPRPPPPTGCWRPSSCAARVIVGTSSGRASANQAAVVADDPLEQRVERAVLGQLGLVDVVRPRVVGEHVDEDLVRLDRHDLVPKPVPGRRASGSSPRARTRRSPPSAREVCTQLYWSMVSATVAVPKSRSIGCRGHGRRPRRPLRSSLDRRRRRRSCGPRRPPAPPPVPGCRRHLRRRPQPAVLTGDELGRVDRQPVAQRELDVAGDLRLDRSSADAARPPEDRQLAHDHGVVELSRTQPR